MSNGTAAAASSAGGGIAFLRRQFELRVDPLYETPMKPPVRKRPSSFIDPKAIKTPTVDGSSSNVRPEHVQPKPRDATILSDLDASDPRHVPSTSSSAFSSSSSSASSSSSQTTVDAAAGVGGASSKDADDRQMEEIQDRRGDGTSNDIMSHSHDLELTPTPPFHPSDVNTSKDVNDSSAELTEAETNDKHETKETSSANNGSKETNSSITNCLKSNAGEFNHARSTSACNPPEMESTNGVLKTGMKRGKDYDADRRPPEETLPPAQMSPNSKSYLSPSNAAPKKMWMPVTRSMENLCSDSSGTPTKESKNFCEKKPNDILLSAKATDAVTTSQSLDRSTSMATKVKPPVRGAKKPPPPPVPKKNVKFAEVSKSRRAIVDDGAKEDSNPNTKLSSEEGNSSSPSSEATTESEGGDQSDRSQLRRSETTSTKVTRPTSFFPPMQQSPAIRRAVESAVEYDRYKSLPTLSQGDSPVCNRKDTMFPCSRQKLRPQVLAAESGHVGGSGAITPEIYQRNSIGDNQLLLASPMSLGNRTPPGIESVIAATEEHLTDHRPSYASSNCPLPTPINSDIGHTTTVTPDTLIPPPSSDLETFDMSSAPEQQVSGSNQFLEMSDADSFLDDTFEFLSCDAQPNEDESTIISPLKLWTDTWCKSSTKNQNEIPSLQASTTDSKINDSQKGIEISTKDDINVQDNVEKSRLKTTAKIEEDKQRTTEVKQVVKRSGSSAIGVDRKSPENAKDIDTIERPKLFGVVLRNNSNCSLARRSTIVSAIPGTSATNASSPSSFSSSLSPSAATSVRDRRSTAIVRTPSDTRSLSRLSSLTSLTILPSNRPVAKLPGKYIGGKPSIILDGTSSMIQQHKKTADIDTELDAIDKAFDFLDRDDSGA